jgi:hypothetical protein
VPIYIPVIEKGDGSHLTLVRIQPPEPIYTILR